MSIRPNTAPTKGRTDRPASRYQSSGAETSRQRKTNLDSFTSQNIWENLTRLRQHSQKPERIIRSSYFVFLFNGEGENSALKTCLDDLHKHIDQHKFEFMTAQSEGNDSIILILKNFNLLDGCLLLSVIANHSAQRYSSSPVGSYFVVPQNVRLSCRLFILSKSKFTTATRRRKGVPGFTISCKPSFTTRLSEVRIAVQPNRNIETFINGVALMLTNARFEKHPQGIDNHIQVLFNGSANRLKYSLLETRFINGDIFDPSDVVKNNELVKQSSKIIEEYKKGLNTTNSPKSGSANDKKSPSPTTGVNSRATSSATSPSTTRYKTGTQASEGQNTTSNNHSQGNLEKPGYLTQEQIKEHCVASISAAKVIMQTKSSQDILKTYIRIPKLKYMDIILDRLKDLRGQSHCNIIVLNLNNLHESDAWFNSLDVSKYTSVIQAPHPSTVRILCIGGITEYILIALDKIGEIMNM